MQSYNSTTQEEPTYFGKFRNKNPTGKDGKTLKCHKCGSENHLMKDCKAQQGSGNGSFYSSGEQGTATQPQLQFTNVQTSLFQQPIQTPTPLPPQTKPDRIIYQPPTTTSTAGASMVQPQLQLYVNTEADDPLAGILTGRGVTQEFHMVQEHSQEQQDTSHNYGCEICGWWDHLSPFPFPNCYWCGDRPSYHHGRCCPKLPKESSTENTDLDPSENPLFNMIFGKRDVETLSLIHI